jgi:hypothetical protein
VDIELQAKPAGDDKGLKDISVNKIKQIILEILFFYGRASKAIFIM